jgi:hypothetical protein
MDATAPAADPQDDFADWREALSAVEGLLVGRERRIGAADLFALLDLNDVTRADRNAAGLQIKRIMRSLGWKPKVTKIDGKPVRGYVRRDPKARPAPPKKEPAEVVVNRPVLTPTDTPDPRSLSQQLERVAGLALDQAETILTLPIEGADGNLMRAKTSVVNAVLATQSRVDENILRSKRDSDDVLTRLEKIIRRARREIPGEPKKTVEVPSLQTANPAAA